MTQVTPNVRPPQMTARVRCRMPMHVQKRYLILNPGGELVELEWMFVTAGRWRKWPERSAPTSWCACGIGPFILAFRVRFGAS
jgi:hypothetical protein